MRRYLYLFAIVLVIAIVMLAGVLVARRVGPGAEPVDTGGGSSTTGGLPVAPPSNANENVQGNTGASGEAATNYEGQKFSVIAENKALGFFVNTDASVVLVQPDGQIMKAQGGQVSPLSSSPVANLIAASFSFDGKKILAVFGDRRSPETSIFDVTSKTWRPLPPNIQSPSWSPTNYQIAYLGERNGSGMIFTLDTSKTAGVPQEILKINIQDAQLRWIAQNQIILSDRGSAFTNGSVWNLNIKNKTLVPLVVENPGLDSIWEGQYALGFTADRDLRGGRLSLLDAVGNLLHEMAFSTLPAKCVFDTETITPITTAPGTKKTTSTASTTAINKTLYCAIPKDVESFQAVALPDSYFRKELFTQDEFYAVNVSDGKTEAVSGVKNLSIDATNLKVFNNTLFFINRLDEKLYAISLD